MAINELRSIQTFLQTAELGSLRRAAAAQGVTPQAASQALAQLEQHLGVRLFHRTTRSMALTAEGRQFMEAVAPSVQGLQRALAGVQHAKDEIAGPLKIVGPRSTFRPALWPLLDEFCTRYPDVQPEVQLDDRIGNWVEERVDVGFRVGAATAEGLVARRLFSLQLIMCASPEYLRRYGAPVDQADLANHRCSVFRHSGIGRSLPWTFKEGDTVVDREVTAAFNTNDEELELDAMLGGHVIALATGVTAAALIREGRLVPLLVEHVSDEYGVHIYWGTRTAQPARVRAFIDLAIERLTNNPAFVLSAKELAAAEAKGRKAYVGKRSGGS